MNIISKNVQYTCIPSTTHPISFEELERQHLFRIQPHRRFQWYMRAQKYTFHLQKSNKGNKMVTNGILRGRIRLEFKACAFRQ